MKTILWLAMGLSFSAWAEGTPESKVRVEYKREKAGWFDFKDFDYSTKDEEGKAKIAELFNQNECYRSRANSLKNAPFPKHIKCPQGEPMWIYTFYDGDRYEAKTTISVACLENDKPRVVTTIGVHSITEFNEKMLYNTIKFKKPSYSYFAYELIDPPSDSHSYRQMMDDRLKDEIKDVKRLIKTDAPENRSENEKYLKFLTDWSKRRCTLENTGKVLETRVANAIQEDEERVIKALQKKKAAEEKNKREIKRRDEIQKDVKKFVDVDTQKKSLPSDGESATAPDTRTIRIREAK